jgi:serine protease Do
MNTRTWTLGSFFTVAMSAMLLGAVVTNQIRRPELALARNAEAAALPARSNAPVTLDTFRDIARRETAGVVNISTSKLVKRQAGGGDMDELMERFFGPQGRNGGNGGNGSGRQTQRSLGSGFIVDKDGYILTNRHVVEGADQISVEVSTGPGSTKRFDAKLKGMDARTDVALIKIEPTVPLTVVDLGDSDQTDVGEWVMAIGNPFGLGGNSVTVGVVSYKGRPLNLGTQGTSIDMIQTDASINPGNSGGPLINTRGQVIGINTLIITQGMPQSAGVGFAVPINVAKEILPQLRERGRVTRGWLGVQIQAVTEDMARTIKGLKDGKGAIVSDVTPGGPAEKADLRPGDVITAVDGQPLADNSALSRYIAAKAPGVTVKLQVLRESSERTVPVTLGTFPDEQAQAESDNDAHGQLGMSLKNLTPPMADQLQLPRGTRGVVVTDVEAGSAAEDAALQQGDIIESVSGQVVETVDQFQKAIAQAKADGFARLRVRRGTNHTFLVLRLS